MGYIGYLECDNCSKIVYITKPSEIEIWFHPDDPRPLCEAKCTNCGEMVSSRIDHDHMANFKRRGCSVRDLNDKFPPLTEEEIESWDVEADLKQFELAN